MSVKVLGVEAQNYPKEHYVRLHNTGAGNQGVIDCTFGALIDLITTLEMGNRDIATLKDSVHSLASLIYPTDDPAVDELLIYYREREWRITNDFSRNGVSIAQDLTKEDKDYLTNLNPGFCNIIEMRDGKISYIDACYKLMTFEGNLVLKMAKRLIAPEACLEEAIAILKQHNVDIEVSSLEGAIAESW